MGFACPRLVTTHHKRLLGFYILLYMHEQLPGVPQDGNVIICQLPWSDRLALQDGPMEMEYVCAGPRPAFLEGPLTGTSETAAQMADKEWQRQIDQHDENAAG